MQSSEQGNHSPAQISPSTTNTEPGGLQLEKLSQPELIEVVMRLQAELSRRASSAAFLQTLARYLLAGLIVLIPFRYRWVLLPRPMPPLYDDYTDFLLYASDVLLILTLAAWLTSLALRPRRIQIGPRLLALPLGGLVVIASLTSLTSLDISLSVYHSIRLVLLAGLYLYLVNELRGLKDLALPLLISLFIQSTVAVGQILAQHSLGIKSLGELDLDPARNGISVVSANGVRALRAYGLSDHPNILGGCLVFALILITAWFIGEAKRGRLVASSLVALGTLGLFFTFSRAAWLAYGLALLFMVFILIRKRKQEPVMHWLSLAAASLLILIPFVIQNASNLGMRLGWQNSFSTDAQEVQSLGERQLLMSDANHIFLQHPLTGVGLGAFPLALLRAFPQFPVDYQPPHIVLLDASAETGIFGGIFYLIASLAPWVLLWLNRKRLTFSPALLGSSALLLAISVVSLFDYYPWILISGALWQWLAWGVWSASFLAALHGKDDPYD